MMHKMRIFCIIMWAFDVPKYMCMTSLLVWKKFILKIMLYFQTA